MTPRTAALAATLLTMASGLAVVATSAALIADSATAHFRRPRDQARVDILREKVQASTAQAQPLLAAYAEVRDASLIRDARNQRSARVLVAAAAVFLLSAKWLVALRRTQPLIPLHVRRQHAASSAGATPIAAPQLNRNVPPLAEPLDLTMVDRIIAQEGCAPEAAIPILQAIQEHFRYLPDAALRRVCERTEITPAQLVGVASFYTQFRRTPIGRHLITVCHGTACHVAGATRITDELRRRLGLAPDQDTDAARDFTLQQVPCLGCCTLAPVVQIDGTTHGHAEPTDVPRLLHECQCGAHVTEPAESRAVAGADWPARHEIRIGLGSCCVANGSGVVHAALLQGLRASRIDAAVKRVGCVGMCHQTPFVEVVTRTGDAFASTLYARVRPAEISDLLRRHFHPPGVIRRVGRGLARVAWWFSRNGHGGAAAHRIDPRDPCIAAFLGSQRHIATEHSGSLDPLDLDEYLAHDGFRGLQRATRELVTRENVIDEIRRSGLRGRGGAGYPTWQKWSKVRAAAGEPKYIICNGDEGDPGAFMDRMLMESYPYRIIEGLAIAAYATGASEGVFYIRAEYPLAVKRIRTALERCQKRGLLPLHVRVVQGAGAFVCGEETALIASLEGQRGVPTLRPPYPADEGLHGRPTLVNNVETYAVTPWILRHGAAAFAALGTPTSKGTKVFALTGKIARGGLIEVSMGITIRQIVEDIGGGVRSENLPWGIRPHRFKAVQIGGPSGGCIPADRADTPVDFEALAAVGAMMGSGGLVVLDDTDCMVDIARYFLAFTQNQSCGKCTPCRIGTRRMLEILERICSGQGRADDLETLEQLARMVQDTSLCGLGKTAPNPVLTTLRYFREEYEAHLAGRCPAGRCKSLITYRVTADCTGCTLCAQYCPAGAIALRPYERHDIDATKCTRCDVCRTRCPEDAIRIE